MTFSKLVGVGSDCGSSNGLNSLMTHFGQDKSLQQIYFQKNEGSKVVNGFRSHSSYAQSSDNLANEFFQQNEQVEKLNHHISPFQQLNKEDWSQDFIIQQSPHHHHQFKEFEYIYQHHSNKSSINQRTWSDEFSMFQHQQTPSSEVSEEEQLAFERAFEEVVDESEMFFDHQQEGWDKEFASHETRKVEQNEHSTVPIIPATYQMHHTIHWPENDLSIKESLIENKDWIEKDDEQVVPKEKAADKKEWDRLKPNGIPYGYRAIHSEYENYECMTDNPYLSRQDAIDSVEHTTLADIILALEAKVQLDPKNAKAWEQLGLKQQENERDAAAITALEKAVALDHTCLDAWLALSVSYTNEHCRMDAFNCLEQWIFNNLKYKRILRKELGTDHSNEKKRHDYITNIFLEAARSAPGVEMDADVQVGLGVLFNMSEEYGKAVDCFKSALISRPKDYQLWNKVGATLANSRDSTGAVEMYFNALQINPSFVRARYNLAISCMNLGQHQEAAEHFLTSLALQRAAALSPGEAARAYESGLPVNIPNGTSHGIWGSLRLLMFMMNREDLASQCDYHNLDAFYGQFDF